MKRVPKETFPLPEKLPGPRGLNCYIKSDGLLRAYGSESEEDFKTIRMEFSTCVITEDDAIRTLIGIAKHVGAKRIFEIGTNVGSTAANLALSGFEVHTLDLHRMLPPYPDSYEGGFLHFGGELPGILCRLLRLPVIQYLDDSTKFNPNGIAGTFDLVFVDGAHDYEHVRSDTNLAGHLIHPKGTIVWDDACAPGVSRVLETIEGVTVIDDVDLAYWTAP